MSGIFCAETGEAESAFDALCFTQLKVKRIIPAEGWRAVTVDKDGVIRNEHLVAWALIDFLRTPPTPDPFPHDALPLQGFGMAGVVAPVPAEANGIRLGIVEEVRPIVLGYMREDDHEQYETLTTNARGAYEAWCKLKHFQPKPPQEEKPWSMRD